MNKCYHCGEMFEDTSFCCSLSCLAQAMAHFNAIERGDPPPPYSVKLFKRWLQKYRKTDPDWYECMVWSLTKTRGEMITAADLTHPNKAVRNLAKSYL